ncbi:MAG: septum formation initiator family protein [Pseudomonadota bacterium]
MINVKRFVLDVVLPALIACWVASIAYGAISGVSGYGAVAELKKERTDRQAELDALIDRRLVLGRRADMLNPSQLDLDMVEERIRVVLGYAHQDDVILPQDELQRLIEAEKGD